ncbi:hypothetical protein [Methylobacter sp. YRD-M1]|uniref:hypothetical protein n=1 Tax=Methylobacter sp. YRD-M1 TaxID=2911520 RepID=UPI00227C7F42|nr:hypothetical protein [Methylobacter sp. YRD-M1]WAK02876.1 hypothetical protein LZ558_03570 [Methylobacter sp. YRD-M1]
MNQSTTASQHQHQHQQVQLLLPWYIKQSLLKHEHRLVEHHIRYCLACRKELDSLRKLAEAIAQVSDQDLAAETSFASLRTKLPARAQSSASVKTTLPGRIGKFANKTSAVFAIAASLLLMVIPLMLHTVQTNPTGDYYTLSAAKPEAAGGKELRVVFAKSLSDAEVAAVLAAIHGQLIGEPNSVGALTVRLEADDSSPRLQEAIALLRSRQDVLLAEPVTQP